MEVAPHVHQFGHRAVKVIGAAGQHGGINGACRGAADDGKRVGRHLCALCDSLRAFAQRQARGAAQLRNGGQHAHLISGTRAAA